MVEINATLVAKAQKGREDPMNAKIRQMILERDGYQCQFSKLTGFGELTGVPCSEDLDVHHLTYRRFGYERLEDGIAYCTRCHDVVTDAIRRERAGAQLEPDDVPERILGKESVDVVRDYSVQDHTPLATDYAQRAVGKPAE